MRKLMTFLGKLTFAAIILASAASGARAQSAPFVPDYAFGNKPGMIAVRGPNRWQAIPAGTSGQVLASQGPSAVPSWITPSGTGNVQTDGAATAGQFPSFTNGTTLGHMSGGGTLLDNVTGISGTGAGTIGFGRRTAAGTYTWAAIATGDLPALAADTDNSCTVAAGSGTLTCSGIYGNTHSYTALQGYNNGLDITGGDLSGSTADGLHFEYNGSVGSFYAIQRGVSFRRLNIDALSLYVGTVNPGMPITLNGPTTIASLSIGAALPVASGGTGQASGGGAALDAVSGITTTGILYRNSAATYSTYGLSQLIDGGFGSTQGSILYRGSSGWTALTPGTSGQFLASNGSGANVSWASPSAPPAGSRVLLNTITISSGAASADDSTSISGTYSEYDIYFENVLPTAAGACNLQLYIGGTKQTSGYQSSQFDATNYNGGNTAVGGSTTFIPCGSQTENIGTTGSGITGNLHITNPAKGGRQMVNGQYAQDDGSGANPSISQGHYSGLYSAGGAISGLSFSVGGTTLASGKIKVYGSN